MVELFGIRAHGSLFGMVVFFGTTGGVIEAAVRTAYEVHTKKELPRLDFDELRGMEGIRSEWRGDSAQ